MNITAEMMQDWGYQQLFDNNQRLLQMVFGASESLCCFDTYQFKDYSKVVADRFDTEKKARRRGRCFRRIATRPLPWGPGWPGRLDR